MQEEIYCGPKGSFSACGMLFKPGDRLTQKAKDSVSAKMLRRYLKDGTLNKGVHIATKKAEPDTPFKDVSKPIKLDTVGRWDLDPIDLSGMSLQQLNIMVLERDPTMTPFETLEEVAAQLSKDFKGKIE